MKKLVVLTGAGISAESGVSTFRDKEGLWEKYKFEEIATPQAWEKNPDIVRNFYNQRRKQLFEVSPNPAHYGLVELEKNFEVSIITQNIDDLHERAGSSKILHLHGELKKVRSTVYPDLIYELDGWEQKPEDRCEKGHPLRPHVVWFGEPVPAMADAAGIAKKADIFVVIGTSLSVYPAAGLLYIIPRSSKIFVIDPKNVTEDIIRGVEFIQEKASKGVKILQERLKELQ